MKNSRIRILLVLVFFFSFGASTSHAQSYCPEDVSKMVSEPYGVEGSFSKKILNSYRNEISENLKVNLSVFQMNSARGIIVRYLVELKNEERFKLLSNSIRVSDVEKSFDDLINIKNMDGFYYYPDFTFKCFEKISVGQEVSGLGCRNRSSDKGFGFLSITTGGIVDQLPVKVLQVKIPDVEINGSIRYGDLVRFVKCD